MAIALLRLASNRGVIANEISRPDEKIKEIEPSALGLQDLVNCETSLRFFAGSHRAKRFSPREVPGRLTLSSARRWPHYDRKADDATASESRDDHEALASRFGTVRVGGFF
jgi:hypothetical protein